MRRINWKKPTVGDVSPSIYYHPFIHKEAVFFEPVKWFTKSQKDVGPSSFAGMKYFVNFSVIYTAQTMWYCWRTSSKYKHYT
jgi:hypothetical protein